VIRILYVMTSLDVGGAERSLLELVRRLDRTQFEPSVCTLISGGRLVTSFEALQVPVYELGVRAGLAELNGLRIVPLLRRLRPQIVHSRLILSNLWARLARFRAPVISEERGLAEDRPAFMTVLNRLSAPLASRTIANSEAVAARLRSRDRVEAIVIRGGIDTGRFMPGGAPQCDIVTVTRLERYKGIFDLIEAMREVVAKRPATTLRIYGGGRELTTTRTMIEHYGLAPNITLYGEDADISARLREGRVFVLASHEEGLPNAVMEAMATSLPVVATSVGGTPELVRDGVTGALVASRDPSSLALAMLSYLENPSRAREHGAAGRARAVAAFDVRTTVSQYETLYRDLVGR
jgi:glycosyltransferase involved in cell wall biosynthesis